MAAAVPRTPIASLKCEVCGKPARFGCSRCLLTAYCSEACQDADWLTHWTYVCDAQRELTLSTLSSRNKGEEAELAKLRRRVVARLTPEERARAAAVEEARHREPNWADRTVALLEGFHPRAGAQATIGALPLPVIREIGEMLRRMEGVCRFASIVGSDGRRVAIKIVLEDGATPVAVRFPPPTKASVLNPRGEIHIGARETRVVSVLAPDAVIWRSAPDADAETDATVFKFSFYDERAKEVRHTLHDGVDIHSSGGAACILPAHVVLHSGSTSLTIVDRRPPFAALTVEVPPGDIYRLGSDKILVVVRDRIPLTVDLASGVTMPISGVIEYPPWKSNARLDFDEATGTLIALFDATNREDASGLERIVNWATSAPPPRRAFIATFRVDPATGAVSDHQTFDIPPDIPPERLRMWMVAMHAGMVGVQAEGVVHFLAPPLVGSASAVLGRASVAIPGFHTNEITSIGGRLHNTQVYYGRHTVYMINRDNDGAMTIATTDVAEDIGTVVGLDGAKHIVGVIGNREPGDVMYAVNTMTGAIAATCDLEPGETVGSVLSDI